MQLTTLNGLGLLDDLLSLGEDQLDVTWVGHVWVDLSRFVSCVLAVFMLDILRGRGHGMCVCAALVPG